MKKITIFNIVALLLFLSVQGFAQERLNETQDLDSIVIENQRIQIPFSKQNREIVILDKAVIQSIPVQSVGALLSYVGGIDVKRRGVPGTQADIGINGGTFGQTLILINGVKIIDPQTGHNMMNLPINLDAVERIEILKGSAASAYGVNALNGAINIVTIQPQKTMLQAHVYGGSSFKKDSSTGVLYKSGGVDVSAGFTTKKTQHFLSLSTIQSNGYRHNTDLNNNKIFYSNELDLNTSDKIKMMGGYVSNDFGSNGFYSAPVDKESKEKVETVIASVQGDLKLSEVWTLRPGLNYRYSFDDYILKKEDPSYYRNKHFTNMWNATLNNSFYTGIGTFGLGLDYRNTHINSNSLGKHNRENLGVFGNYSFDFISGVLINLGLYANYSNEFGWDWMPSVDAGYDLGSHLRIFASTGTGLRLPTYTDLYYVGPVNIGYAFLKPEKALQGTFGLKYNGRKLHASASYFYRNTDDLIDWVKDTLENPWQSRNYYNVKTKGVSFSADYRLLQAKKSNGYDLLAGLSYSWLNPTLSNPDKKERKWNYSHYAMENLKHQLTGRIQMKFFRYFGLTLSGKYQKRLSAKDYFLLAARLEAEVQHFKIYLDADNITNVQFVEAGSAPMPGSWFSLGVKWNWIEN